MIMMNSDPNSSSSLIFFLQLQKTTSLGLLLFSTFFSSIIEDDDKQGGSSLSLGFFLRCRRWWWAGILTCHHFSCFALVAEDDNGLLNLLSFFCIFSWGAKNNNELEACCHLLILHAKFKIVAIRSIDLQQRDSRETFNFFLLFLFVLKKKFHSCLNFLC
jgi:hypothetical protein